ncbi:hypothetical protein [Seleniivibrio woodruffii]|nr:hypothetical protein [Seleniivibrio woodruffii]
MTGISVKTKNRHIGISAVKHPQMRIQRQYFTEMETSCDSRSR